MANIGKWNAPAAAVSLFTGANLNALGSGSMSVSSSNVANQTSLDIYADFEVFLDTLTPGAGGFVALYILEAIDGTNFPNPAAADLRLMTNSLLATLPLGTTNTTYRAVARNVVLPPGIFQIRIDNQAGVAFASTANNTVKYIAYDLNLNG